jgi:regulator of sigma E protease
MGLIPTFGNFLYTALAFVLALSVIVAVHEFGHYIVGRWSGIHAEVFSLGFGPRLWSRHDKRGTRWQIAAFPLGGYVKFMGDANAASAGADEETMAALSPEERRHTMHGAPLWARAATVAAGPIFNFILSILVFSALFMVQGTPTDKPTIGSVDPLPGGIHDIRPGDVILGVNGTDTPDIGALFKLADTLPSQPTFDYRVDRGGEVLTVTGPTLYPARARAIAPGSAALDAGLKAGDVITAVDGKSIFAFDDLQTAVSAANGGPVSLSIWRDGQTMDVTLTPRMTDLPTRDGGFETRFLIGVTGDFFYDPATRAVSPTEAVTAATSQTWFVVKSSISGLYHMVTGSISSCNLRGPLGIAETSGAAASQGLSDFIWFIAVLSTAVGLLNLFPIPVLDGGHLVFHAIEWARGRPPSDRVMNFAMTAGLMVVLSLMIFGLTNDLVCP